jgi:hypothetical protein
MLQTLESARLGPSLPSFFFPFIFSLQKVRENKERRNHIPNTSMEEKQGTFELNTINDHETTNTTHISNNDHS